MINKFELRVLSIQILVNGLALVKFPDLPKALIARVLLARGVQLAPISKCENYDLAVSHGCFCQVARNDLMSEAA